MFRVCYPHPCWVSEMFFSRLAIKGLVFNITTTDNPKYSRKKNHFIKNSASYTVLVKLLSFVAIITSFLLNTNSFSTKIIQYSMVQKTRLQSPDLKKFSGRVLLDPSLYWGVFHTSWKEGAYVRDVQVAVDVKNGPPKQGQANVKNVNHANLKATKTLFKISQARMSNFSNNQYTFHLMLILISDQVIKIYCLQ